MTVDLHLKTPWDDLVQRGTHYQVYEQACSFNTDYQLSPDKTAFVVCNWRVILAQNESLEVLALIAPYPNPDNPVVRSFLQYNFFGSGVLGETWQETESFSFMLPANFYFRLQSTVSGAATLFVPVYSCLLF